MQLVPEGKKPTKNDMEDANEEKGKSLRPPLEEEPVATPSNEESDEETSVDVATQERLEIPGLTFTSDNSKGHLEVLTPDALVTRLVQQMTIYLAKYYQEQQHGLMTQFREQTPTMMNNLAFRNGRFLTFVEKSGVQTKAQAEADVNARARAKTRTTWGGRECHLQIRRPHTR